MKKPFGKVQASTLRKRAAFSIVAALLVTGALAANTDRILRFESSASGQGDLRNGPFTYSGKDGKPIKAVVNNVNIAAPTATLSAPTGETLASAEGKRTALFSAGAGQVDVVRGRLTAKGGQLAYSEATGQGVLTGTPSAVFVPAKKDDGDPVNIQAGQMSLDVDNNMSTSTGSVVLVSGNQTGKADKLVFDEDKEIGVLTGTPSISRAASAKQKEFNIFGDETRVVTKGKLLYVRGNVKLTQGTSTTTGDAVYYNDEKNVAYVVGHAVSTDSKTGTTVRALSRGYLEQRTDLGRVRALSRAFTIPAEQFKLTGEK
ncbi:LptA/OstA family protein [Deinococcus sp.]|uniref:LptA/OstA family protein n=1 Tax=Deinococcus sp. TaxID=47478 RepID=UPI003B596082